MCILNMLTADYEYSRINMGTLPLPIQMYLKNQKHLTAFLLQFLESGLNFQHFENKNGPQRLSISEIVDSERRGELNVEKILFLKALRQSTC